MSVTSQLVIEHRVAANDHDLSGVPTAALPPSDDDPAVGQMRVVVGGSTAIRHYDPTVDVA